MKGVDFLRDEEGLRVKLEERGQRGAPGLKCIPGVGPCLASDGKPALGAPFQKLKPFSAVCSIAGCSNVLSSVL